jgi:hypothetical protein
MIFGITLKHFAKLQQQGDKAKGGRRVLKQLERPHVDKFKARQLAELSFSDYVDLKRFYLAEDYLNFCRIFAIVKWWQVIYIHNTGPLMEEFARQTKELTERYYYIFNAPQYGEPAKETIGSELRTEFVAEFGNDVIITDRLCKGRLVDYKEVEKWKTSEVLFWAHYLAGQKIVEDVK